MSDTRTKREKLAAMAAQSASPEEAAIALQKLREYDDAHLDEVARVLSLDERMSRLHSVVRGWTPGLRVKVAVSDDLWSAPDIDWDGRS